MHDLLNISYIFIYLISLIGLLIFIGKKIRNNCQLFMPNEYKTVKRIVNKISKKNDLGDYPFTFSITAGSRGTWIAKSLGLPKKNHSCLHLRHVNPFIKYKGKLSNEINEAIRQAYLLDTVEACAYPNGYIQISRSSFKCNENFEDYLAFVIGHEISHVLNEDSFNKSLKVSKEGKTMKKKKKIEFGFEISRECEKEADICSAKMLINAGYSTSIPIKAHDFIAKKYGYGYETGKKDTHPGYEDRRNNLIDFIYKNYPDSSDKKGYTKGSWKYDRKENTLTYKIKERYSPPQEENLKAATNLAKAFAGEVIKKNQLKNVKIDT
tara:strand:- start:258 stop:1226 length:969 start_codon:yes stop_codon:yes gene_type:complete